jgi:hypothetical protein
MGSVTVQHNRFSRLISVLGLYCDCFLPRLFGSFFSTFSFLVHPSPKNRTIRPLPRNEIIFKHPKSEVVKLITNPLRSDQGAPTDYNQERTRPASKSYLCNGPACANERLGSLTVNGSLNNPNRNRTRSRLGLVTWYALMKVV